MAKKTSTKATVTPIKKGAPAKSAALKVRVESSEDDAIYANYMEISHSQYEFMLTIARLPVKLGASEMELAKERGEIAVVPEVQVIFPPRIISGLIKALEVQREMYENSFGKIGTTGEA